MKVNNIRLALYNVHDNLLSVLSAYASHLQPECFVLHSNDVYVLSNVLFPNVATEGKHQRDMWCSLSK